MSKSRRDRREIFQKKISRVVKHDGEVRFSCFGSLAPPSPRKFALAVRLPPPESSPFQEPSLEHKKIILARRSGSRANKSCRVQGWGNWGGDEIPLHSPRPYWDTALRCAYVQLHTSVCNCESANVHLAARFVHCQCNILFRS